MPGPQTDSQNLFYGVATILFALSLISERLSNLFKLYIKQTRIKQFDAALEKIRERNVMIISLIFGWITALLAGADFFTLIEKGKLLPFFLQAPRDEGCVQLFFGVFLSGIFISLGSKFWHDMLDIALQFSNLKKYQVSQAADNSRMSTINTIQSKVQIAEPQLQQMAGYSGYDFNTSDASVNLKFDTGNSPTKNQINWLNSTFGQDNYNIVNTNIKVG